MLNNVERGVCEKDSKYPGTSISGKETQLRDAWVV